MNFEAYAARMLQNRPKRLDLTLYLSQAEYCDAYSYKTFGAESATSTYKNLVGKSVALTCEHISGHYYDFWNFGVSRGPASYLDFGLDQDMFDVGEAWVFLLGCTVFHGDKDFDFGENLNADDI